MKIQSSFSPIYDEAHHRPDGSCRPRLSSLGSQVAYPSRPGRRRDLRDRPRPPPVVNTVFAARGILLWRNQGYQGETEDLLQLSKLYIISERS